jgi:hypothetical protein
MTSVAKTSADEVARLRQALEIAIDKLVRLNGFVDGVTEVRPSIRATVALGRSLLREEAA